jgi:LysR family transcriptional regulator, low CO2-responsive transcriptional regulator
VVQTDSSEALKRCALAGVGVAFVSRLAVAAELARGELVVLAAPGLPLRRRLYVAHLRSAPLAAAARAIKSMLRIQ